MVKYLAMADGQKICPVAWPPTQVQQEIVRLPWRVNYWAQREFKVDGWALTILVSNLNIVEALEEGGSYMVDDIEFIQLVKIVVPPFNDDGEMIAVRLVFADMKV